MKSTALQLPFTAITVNVLSSSLSSSSASDPSERDAAIAQPPWQAEVRHSCTGLTLKSCQNCSLAQVCGCNKHLGAGEKGWHKITASRMRKQGKYLSSRESSHLWEESGASGHHRAEPSSDTQAMEGSNPSAALKGIKGSSEQNWGMDIKEPRESSLSPPFPASPIFSALCPESVNLKAVLSLSGSPTE